MKPMYELFLISFELPLSDTTAATLTCLFYELATHPDSLKTLQDEVDRAFKNQTTPDLATLGKLEYLNATINEALRLHPAVPSGVQRMTPPEGVMVGKTFIPGNTIVQCPTHTMFRGKEPFPSGDTSAS